MDREIAPEVRRRQATHPAHRRRLLADPCAELPEWFLGKTIEDFDATAEMWRFFERHPRRGRRR